jgi:hypothetical protein
MTRALLLIATLSSFGALAQKNPDLEKAQQLLAQRKYPDALKALEAAEKKGSMDRDSYLTLLESKGLAYASTNKADKAEEYFRSVLCLDPKRELAGKYAGAVGKPITAAIEWAKQNGALELVALEPGVSDGRVKQISFAVKNDPLKLVKAVKFYVRTDGGSWKPTPGAVTNGSGSLDVDAAQVEWWAETQDLNSNQVAFLGSALKPVKNAAPAPVAVAVVEKKPEPKEEPKPVLTPEPKKEEPAPVAATVTEPAASTSTLRIVGYALMGAGVVALGLGTYFGLTYNSERQAIRDALMSGGSSQSALFARDQAAIQTGTLANVMFITGGALAAGGAVLWFVGGNSSSSMAIMPLGTNGLAVSGTF